MKRELDQLLDSTLDTLEQVRQKRQLGLSLAEVGHLNFVGQGVARAQGLPDVRAEELLRLANGRLGMVFSLSPGEVGIVLLDPAGNLAAGSEVQRSGRVLDVAVGEALLGRVIDPLGRPLDHGDPLDTLDTRPIERPAPAIMERAPVSKPLQTGIKVIDALIPIGRGQRELILGDRQTGKTAIAVDSIINQQDSEVICIYCAIGQQSASVARVIAELRERQALAYSIVVVGSGNDPAGLQYVAPYAATTIGEYFMEQGRDVLIVYDDLTRHARAYRELSLLLRRPPGREAYPGDIFYIHSRLLERATHLKEELRGGSLTALPIIETEAENLAAYIPTNLISITDGQIYLSPELFSKGVLPAIDVGRSVSRVGGKAQLAAYHAVAGSLRLSYAQFEELEVFARFGTRLDEATRKTLERGRRVREVLKQSPYATVPVAEQIAVLLAVSNGLFDAYALSELAALEHRVRQATKLDLPHVYQRIENNQPLSPEDRQALLDVAKEALAGS